MVSVPPRSPKRSRIFSTDSPLRNFTRPLVEPNSTRSARSARSASAVPKIAAASARLSSERSDSRDQNIEPERSTSTSVRPGSAGTLASEWPSARSRAYDQRSDGACW
ncbi:hypothetical protein SVIOM74S_05050 [Streptomyces violarus]